MIHDMPVKSAFFSFCIYNVLTIKKIVVLTSRTVTEYFHDLLNCKPPKNTLELGPNIDKKKDSHNL